MSNENYTPSREQLDRLVEVTSTRLGGALATLHILAEAQKGEGRLSVALQFVAEAIEQSIEEIDQTIEPDVEPS